MKNFKEHDEKELSEIFDSKELPVVQEYSKGFVGHPESFRGTPTKLACLYNEDEGKTKLQASYYVGCDWVDWNLKEDGNVKCPEDGPSIPLIVYPKIEDLDYWSIFGSILKRSDKDECDYFAGCYGVDFSKPEIECEKLVGLISPILVIHYIHTLNILVKKGLKKGYKVVEENLNAKIKGRILLKKHINKNVLARRDDKCYCKYQIYTEDIPENRLLKKALSFALRMTNNVKSINKKEKQGVYSSINRLLGAFDHVGDDIRLSEVKRCGKNKLYNHYVQAIRLAKMILQKYNFSLENVDKKDSKVPAFWIDMSSLFELYVLEQLERIYYTKGNIEFQVKGHYNTKVDYVYKPASSEDVGYIIDAKYKPAYKNPSSVFGILEDIREISGYAMDETIRKKINLKNKNYVPKCIIVYPDEDFIEKGKVQYPTAIKFEEEFQHNKIEGFYQFYKISMKLPSTKKT